MVRVDGPAKATGAAVYTHDVKPPGMLFGRFLTSPHAHAKITKLDLATAKKMNESLASRPACNPKGIFFVRDSIYSDEKQPDYVYDASGGADGVGKYTIPIVELEYSYVTHLANHALVIEVK